MAINQPRLQQTPISCPHKVAEDTKEIIPNQPMVRHILEGQLDLSVWLLNSKIEFNLQIKVEERQSLQIGEQSRHSRAAASVSTNEVILSRCHFRQLVPIL